MEGKKTKSNEFVPVNLLKEIKRDQDKIIQLLEESPRKPPTLEEYFTEAEAQKMLDRKPTWFYNMRVTGKLPFSKVGSKIFYAKRDIIRLIERHKISK